MAQEPEPEDPADASRRVRDAYARWDETLEIQTREWGFRDDLLPGIAGLAEECAKITHDTYLAGLWSRDLHYELLWEVANPKIGDLDASLLQKRDPNPYVAPSWSWASQTRQFELLPTRRYFLEGSNASEEPAENQKLMEVSDTLPCHVCPEFVLVRHAMDLQWHSQFGRLNSGSHICLLAKLAAFPSEVIAKPRTSENPSFGYFSDGSGLCLFDWTVESTLVQPPGEMQLLLVSSCCFQTNNWQRLQSASNAHVPSAAETPAVFKGSGDDGAWIRYSTETTHRRGSGGQKGGVCNEARGMQSGKGAGEKKPPPTPLSLDPCLIRTSTGEFSPRQPPSTSHSRSVDPKPVVRRSLWRFFSGWVIHVPALFLTVGVTVLSQQRLFWYPPSGIRNGGLNLTADDLNNALQLPAKVHEFLIVASLSAIGLSIFRRRLIGDGVRLGFLTGGYRVGDLEYLVSPAFWRQGFGGFGSWDLLLAAYFVFATVLSALVGPASAILLIPTPGWYAMNHDRAFDNISMPLVYPATPESVWPDFFSPDRAPWANQSSMGGTNWENCKGSQGIYQRYCPAGGFSDIWTWAQSFGSSNLQANVTFQAPSIQRNLILTHSNRSTTIATTPSRSFVSTVGLFNNYIRENPVGDISKGVHYKLEPRRQSNKSIYQPLVQSKCKVYDKSELLPGELPYYPTNHLNCFGDSLCQQHRDQPQSFPVTRLNLSQRTGTPPTFRTLGKGGSVVHISGQVPGSTDDTENDWIYGCSLLASWVAANYTWDPWLSRTIESTVSSSAGMQKVVDGDTLEDGYVVRFNESWFPYMDPKMNETGTDGVTRPTTAILRLLNLFTTTKKANGTVQTVLAPVEANNITAAEILLEKLFAVYLTDGLARTGSQLGSYLVLNQNATHIAGIDLLSQHGYFGGVNIIDAVNATHVRWQKQNTTTYVNETIAQMSSRYQGFLEFDFGVQQYGYGSGDPRTTLRFAVAVMSIYLATLTVYALVVACAHVMDHYDVQWRGEPVRVWSVRPWGNLEDLSVLALRSQPPADENLTSSGRGDARSSRVWERVVRVRADDQQNLHLVVDESVPMRRVHHAGGVVYY
ncbi:hypothetical protein LX36DRAFT_711689 [Colletotrichum falcatum]|nr:hypothetical protein LX36DRAFT_711689 [Colletotrichum falcatum]